jgi:hypothetical protein
MIKSRGDGHVAVIEEKRMHVGVLTVNLGENGPLGKHRHKWEINIKLYLREIDAVVLTGLI